MTRWNRPRNRGVIFVAALILLAGMSVVVIALAHEISLDLKMATALVDADQTLEIAKVGIDKIIYALNNDSNWRTTYSSGVKYGPFALGNGEFHVTITDEDGDLADDPIDSVTVTSVATYKGSTRTVSAVLAPPVHDAMMYLAYTSIGAGNMEIYNGPRIYGDLCATDKVEIKDSSPPDHRGGIYVPDPKNVSPALDDANTNVVSLPSAPTILDIDDVDLDWLIANGSKMSPPAYADLVIVDKVISPTSNPYGFANANGIYYIQGDKDVRFIRCHITATIVVQTGRKVYFDEASVHAPAFPQYPALVSDREVYYDFTKNLSEIETGVDFNCDGDQDDVFTPSVSGIVYAKIKIEALQSTGSTNIVRFKGALVSDKVVFNGAGAIFEQDPTLATTLVNGFVSDRMKLVTGSIKIE